MVQFEGLVPLSRGGPRFQGLAAQGKWCGRCGHDLPLAAFYRYPWWDKRHDPPRERMRYSPYCKPCMSEVAVLHQATPRGKATAAAYKKRRYAADPEGWRAKHRVWNEQSRRRRGIQPSVAGTRRCKRCGERKPRAAFPKPYSRLCAACKRVPMAPEERRRRHALCVRSWKERHPDKVREMQRRSNRKYDEAHRKKVPV